MTSKNKLEEILTMPLVQRGVYGLGLLLWIVFMWDALFGKDDHLFAAPVSHSTEISYSTLIVIPIAILVLQIIFNNRVLWSFIFGVFTTYILISAILLVTDVLENGQNNTTRFDWTWKNTGLMALFFITVILIDVIIYYARPRKNSK